MSKGILLFASNNSNLDYVKQAYYQTLRIKKYLGLPVSIVTENVKYLQKNYDASVFDCIIPSHSSFVANNRIFKDGKKTYNDLFKNTNRIYAYDLSPYNETLLIDTDYVLANNLLINCFDSSHDFLIYKEGFDLCSTRSTDEFKRIYDTSVDFYWATAVFFRKTYQNKLFFELVKHIYDNYTHYRKIYQISTKMYRNDYCFSIAIHIMNGFRKGDFAQSLPGNMWYTTGSDYLYEINQDNMLFLIEKPLSANEYNVLRVKGRSVHVMNKFSLERVIDGETDNE